MERTGIISGSARTRGCGTIRRFLTHLGAQLIGLNEEQESDAPATWWDDTLSLARVGAGTSRSASIGLGSRQVEFWVDEDLRQPSSVVRETRAEYRAEPTKPIEQQKISAPPKATVRQSPVSVPFKKGVGRVNIARFLSVNGGVYSGRNDQRWLALPEREKGMRFELMKQRDTDVNADFKVARSLPRGFGGMSCR